MLKAVINRALLPLGLKVTRALEPPPPAADAPGNAFSRPPADEGWDAERAYWEAELRRYYAAEFGLELTPLQTDSGLVPPSTLATFIQNVNKAHPDGFFASGYRTTLSYLKELRDYGRSPAEMDRILEVGIGLGRLMVHYTPFRAELHGCDVTSSVLDWTRKTLGGRVRLELTGTEPPLPYPNHHFDFVYANSVFTHIHRSQLGAWAAELARVTRPGGLVIVSVLDPNHYLRFMTYRDYYASCQGPGSVTWDADQGVLMLTYQSREDLYATFGNAGLRVLELRSHFRDQRHLICRREH